MLNSVELGWIAHVSPGLRPEKKEKINPSKKKCFKTRKLKDFSTSSYEVVLCIKWDESTKSITQIYVMIFLMLNAVSKMKKKKNRAKHKVEKEKKLFHKKMIFLSFFIKFFLFILCQFAFIAKARKNYGEILFISKAVSVFVCWEGEKREKNFMSRRCSLLMGCIFLFSMFFSSFYDSFRFFLFSSANTVSCSLIPPLASTHLCNTFLTARTEPTSRRS